MESEYEVKYFPVNKQEIRKKLKNLGAKLVHAERKMKRVIVENFNNPHIKAHYLRVRDEDGVIRLSAKVHAEEGGEIGDQKELDLEVGSFEKMVEMFKLMGFSIDKVQENLRETWEIDNVLVEIDTWPWLDPRVEIEGSSDKEVKKVSDKLGFNWEDKLIVGMFDIYQSVYKLPDSEMHDKLSNLTFEDNPFDTI